MPFRIQHIGGSICGNNHKSSYLGRSQKKRYISQDLLKHFLNFIPCSFNLINNTNILKSTLKPQFDKPWSK